MNSNLHHKHVECLSELPSTPVSTLLDGVMHTEYVPVFILGDSAYPGTASLVLTDKVIEVNRCLIPKKLNRTLASIQYCIENAFRIYKGRFRILNRLMKYAGEIFKKQSS